MQKSVPELSIEEMVSTLISYDDQYAIGEPLVPDGVYDAFRFQAESVAPNHPYFKTVGSMVRGGKVELPYIMGSLDEPKGQSGLDNWVSRFNLSKATLIASHKLDGISCTLHYNYGKLQQAFSRGDGVKGADITRHVMKMPSVQKTIPFKGSTHTRHEIIMKQSTFDSKYAGGKYKTALGLVAGSMNRSTTPDDILSDIDIVSYDIINIEDDSVELTKTNALKIFNEWGFLSVKHIAIDSTQLTVDFLTPLLKEFRDNSDYNLDGIVITNDDYVNTGERDSQSLNPTHSIKFKTLEKDAIVQTRVLDVLWEIGKTRNITPRVEFEPVKIFGTTVRFATGFNAKYINDNNIGKGTLLNVTKSGSVIPYIVEVVESTTASLPDVPCSWGESGVELMVECDHPTVLFKEALSFFISLDVELLKEATLTKMFDEYKLWGESLVDVCNTLFDLVSIEWDSTLGVNGTKVHDSLHRRLNHLTEAKLIGSLPYLGNGIGVRKVEQLMSQMSNPTLHGLTSLTVDYIVTLDGFDVLTAEKIVQNMPMALQYIKDFSDYITFIEDEKTNEMEGVVVVMTGFRDNDLKESIIAMGGRVTSGVSKKTTHLLTSDINSTSGKTKKARDLGINIMKPVDFKDYFNV